MYTPGPSPQRGTSLIELILFIVIVSTSVAGVLIAIDRSARSSAEPLVIKQALAIAEALLEEVQLMPFTYCDPDDVPVVRTDARDRAATKLALLELVQHALLRASN